MGLLPEPDERPRRTNGPAGPGEPVSWLVVPEGSLMTTAPAGVYVRLADVLAFLDLEGAADAALLLAPILETLRRLG